MCSMDIVRIYAFCEPLMQIDYTDLIVRATMRIYELRIMRIKYLIY